MFLTVAEMRRITVEQVIGAGPCANKQLLFRYDLGRERVSFVVVEFVDGEQLRHIYDTLKEAIEVYNDL